MIFQDFIGNSAVRQRLEGMLSGGRLPHAIVIEGPSGSGRRTLARIIARTAACTAEKSPCGECAACRNGSANPDIFELSTDKATVTVDLIREIRNQAYVKPMQSAVRVFIIPEAQRMNQQAQNALLKVLEEPPARVLFILTCEYTRQLLETVVSRVSVLSLSAPEPAEVVDFIVSRYEKYDRDAVRDAFAGTVGATLARLEGQEGYLALAHQVARALSGGELAMHKLLRPIEKDRDAQKGLCQALRSIFHDALAVGMGAPREFSADDIRRELAERFTAEQLLSLTEVCNRAEVERDFNVGGALFVTLLSARLYRAVQ